MNELKVFDLELSGDPASHTLSPQTSTMSKPEDELSSEVVKWQSLYSEKGCVDKNFQSCGLALSTRPHLKHLVQNVGGLVKFGQVWIVTSLWTEMERRLLAEPKDDHQKKKN